MIDTGYAPEGFAPDSWTCYPTFRFLQMVSREGKKEVQFLEE